MTARSIPAPDLSTRRAPGLGGLNTTVLGLEIRRLFRNRRTVMFALFTRVFLFVIFGLNQQ